MFAVKRIFPAVKLRPQTPPIHKREIGNTAEYHGGRRYNIRGGGTFVSLFTCQVKSTFKENRALTPNVPPYFNQSSRRIDSHVVQLQLKIVNNYT